MALLLIVATYLFNFYVLLQAMRRDVNFLYTFIICNLISNMVLTQLTEMYSGIVYPIRFLHLVMLVIYVVKNRIKNTFVINAILIYMALILLVFRNINTFTGVIYISSYFLLFTAGSSLAMDDHFEKKIKTISKLIILLSTLYIIITISFGLGKEMYSADVTVGGLGSDRIAIVAFAFITIFLYLYRFKYSSKNILYLIIAVALLYIVSKRLPLILMAIAILIIVLQSKMNFRRIFFISITAVLSLFIVFFVLPEKYKLDRRGNKGNVEVETVENESRFMEYIVLPEYISSNNYLTLMIGNGFESTQDYCFKYIGILDRPIHTGIIHNFYTIGFIGSLLFVFFYIKVFTIIKASFLRMRKNPSLYYSPIIYLGYPSLAMIIMYNCIDGVYKEFASFIVFVVLGKIYGDYKYSTQILKRKGIENEQLLNAIEN